MKARIFFCALTVLLLANMPIMAQVLRLDFGTKESPLREGFTRVTSQGAISDDGAVASWVGEKDLQAADHPVPRSPFPPPVYTNDLRQDSLQSANAATLRLHVPKGTYKVWALVGTGGGGWEQVWDVQLVNTAQSTQTQATFWGGYAARILTLEAVAKEDGVLDIQIRTRSRWSVNAMVVVPAHLWESQAKMIQHLEREVLLLPDDVLKDWTEVIRPVDHPTPEYSAAQLARGYVVYQRPWVTPVWPNDLPRPDEMKEELRAFLSPDEYEPVTFTILPLKPLGAVEVEVSDLVSEQGHRLPSNDIQVRYVQYKIVRPNYKTFGTYYQAPSLLPRLDSPKALTEGENFTVWLTLHASKDTPAGVYRGVVRVKVHGSQSMDLPMLVRVLPVELQSDPSVTYTTYYRHPSRYLREATDEFSRQWWQKKIDSDMASMVAYGYNGFRPDVSAGFDSKGNPVVDLRRLKSQLQAAQSHGMDVNRPMMGDIRPAIHSLYRQYMNSDYGSHLYDVKMPPDAFFQQVTRLVAAIEAERKANQLPELLYSLVDEPASTKESIAFTHRIYQAARQVPGIRTFLTIDPGRKGYESLHDVVNVWVSPFVNKPNVDRAALADKGIEVWCYPNAVAGENDGTPLAGARMTYGFARWKAGVPAMMPWIYESWGGDPENNLDALQMDMFNHTTDDAQLLPCMLYEAYREGIDDNRYLYTLERLVADAYQAGLSTEAQDAQADIAFVREAVPVRDLYQYESGWADDSFNAFRWLIARRIMLLDQALKNQR